MKRAKAGFTLIELLIVVAIISAIALVIVPFVLSRQQKEETDDSPGLAVQQSLLEQTGPAPTTLPPPSVLPTLESADVSITLRSSHRLRGMEVYTLYDATVQGEYLFRNERSDESVVRLEFPFPSATIEARAVSLAFVDAAAKVAEPPHVEYLKNGIRWIGLLSPGQPLRVRVTSATQGRELFDYRLPGTGRARTAQIRLDSAGVSPEHVPRDSLQPTSVAPGQLSWSYENLVVDRPLLVELPGATSPLGRVMLLCKLVGLAVLLFGLGFWFLSKGYRPAQLDEFRWGDFLLLATTYSLFFVVFAVLSFHGSLGLWGDMAVAGVLSWPLLLLHVCRVTDLRFALTRVLPLALFTLALVVNGVYGGPVRDHVFIGAAVAIMAYLTVVYRRWWQTLRAHEQQRAQQFTREAREHSAGDEARRLEAQVKEVTPLEAQARSSLQRTDPPTLQRQRDRVSHHLTELAQLHQQRAELLAGLPRLPSLTGEEEHRRACADLGERSTLLGQRLEQVAVQLREALELLEQGRRAREEAREECLEGARQAELTLLEQIEQARETTREAGELLASSGEGESAGQAELERAWTQLQREQEELAGLLQRSGAVRESLHALAGLEDPEELGPASQARRQSAEQLAQRIASTTAALAAATLRLDNLLARPATQAEQEHCLACGTAGPSTPHCPACGVPRPRRMSCPHCGTELLLPVHLVNPKVRGLALHCLACGTQHVTPV